MRRTSKEGRFAERVVSGVDDLGVEERIVIWIERKPGGLWAVGRAVNPQHRRSDEPRPDDYLFEGFELEDALEQAERRQLLHHRARRRRRHALVARERGDGQPLLAVGELVDPLQVVLDRDAERCLRHWQGGYPW